ncbi:MAG: AMP-binding protein, partial [Sphaerochaetaceae bacterium]|nr:AMP-binding protein [Sphaerochaetaceae bacterium]
MNTQKYSEEELKIAPWLKSYGEVKFHLDYPDISMYRAVLNSAEKYPCQDALCFQEKNTDFRTLVRQIKQTAKAFSAIGIKEGDTVTVCMPNIPQTVMCLYAINSIGAVASMIHPLSAVGEIVFYLEEAKSKTIVTIDQFYSKICEVRQQTELDHIIVASVSDALSPVKKVAYKVIKERKFPKVNEDGTVLRWNRFYKNGDSVKKNTVVEKKGNDVAVILFSGGTTGTSKGIQLTNINFNSLALQTGVMCNKQVQGATMLAAMPMFHGFGLGVCVHTMMYWGGRSYLVPQVSVKGYSDLLKTATPNFFAGVPTPCEG